MGELTRRLNAARQGDAAAQEDVYRLVEPELRKLARHWIRRRNDHGQVRTTLLIDMTFQRLVKTHSVQWKDRTMFYCFAARNMCQILIDMSRERTRRAKHEVSLDQHQLEELALDSNFDEAMVISLRDALDKLEERDPILRQIVELHYLLEFTFDEISEIISLARNTAHAKCQLALSFLSRELSKGDSRDAGDVAES